MPEPFIRQSVSMPMVMLVDLKREAAERDMTLSALVREFIRSGRLRDTHGSHGSLDLRRVEVPTDGDR